MTIPIEQWNTRLNGKKKPWARRPPKPKPPERKSRYEVLAQCVGTLAGLDQQLGCATHMDDLGERIGWLQLHAPPDLPAAEAQTLEDLRLWIQRTRDEIGGYRAKLAAMRPPLVAAGEAIRKGDAP